MNIIVCFLVGLIKIYQKLLSPLKPYRTCKFYPTCSTYAIEALKRYGIFKGGFKALMRILRCNPFNRGGYDPLD